MEQDFVGYMWILWTLVAIIFVFTYLCKWNHASSEKNVNCGSISPSTIDCRNKLQKWTLLVGSSSYKAWITVILYGLSSSNCVSVAALDFVTPVPSARVLRDFLSVCTSLANMSSNFFSASAWHLCFFLVYWQSCCSEFIHQIVNCLFAGISLIIKFTSKFLPILSSRFHISHGCHTEIHIALKYTTPLTTYHWEQMANGADNCCLMLTNHKQTPTHELHCSLWNIMLSSSPQVNYFPSFQTLSAVRHADSSVKFVCTSQQAAHQLPWNPKPWVNQSTHTHTHTHTHKNSV
jgi:hypothetical protein